MLLVLTALPVPPIVNSKNKSGDVLVSIESTHVGISYLGLDSGLHAITSNSPKTNI